MALVLVLASVLWPISLGAAVWLRLEGRAPATTAVVYAAGSRICHQRDERSFHTRGARWPVCARCSALYLAAPVGAIAAVAGRRRSTARRGARGSSIAWLAVASVPTALTLVLELANLAPMTNAIRAAAAVPLGAMVAFVVVRAAGPIDWHR
jgi:uncharacterized membrane protein